VLIELVIRDLALIQEADLVFGEGLNAVTGETGAGKSLLVGALEILLGETPRGGAAAWVREGARSARVEGRFAIADKELARRVEGWCAEHLPDHLEALREGDGEVVLARTLGTDGRTRAHVDGRPVTRRALRALAQLLVEVHGQNEHQRLLEGAEQLRLLDDFGGLSELREAAAGARDAWLELDDRLRALAAERQERVERLDHLRYRREELALLGLGEGERDELTAERTMLRRAEELRGTVGGLVQELREREGSLLERLTHAERIVGDLRPDLPALDQPSEELRAAVVSVEEASVALASFLDGVERDPARLEEVEERLATIERLEARHDAHGDELLGALRVIEEEVARLEGGDREEGELGEESERARAKALRAASKLTKARTKLLDPLRDEVVGALKGLGLERADFEAVLAPRAPTGDGDPDRGRLTETGADELCFVLAANPGEARRPLAQVASGGEAARIMLALRGVLAAADRGRTLVFDEIDSGVGGRLGPEVAARLRLVAGHHQVLCVTHLPAIAAAAHVHLRAAKAVRGGRTRTIVEELAGDEREREVAAMIAGGAEEETARAEARRLLEAQDAPRKRRRRAKSAE
jgi:DNA repair protein RecN (Recombination protein N)